MTAEAYCYEKAAPIGSAFYFSLRKLNPAEKDAVVAVAAFYREIEDIFFECHEPALAMVKFNWWRGEVAKLSLGQPEHPVSLLLQKHAISPQVLADMIDGMEESVEHPNGETFREVKHSLQQTIGIREMLIAQILLFNHEPSPEIIHPLSVVLGISTRIQHLHRYITHGINVFAEEELQRFGVTLADFEELKTTVGIKELLTFEMERIQQLFNETTQSLSKSERMHYANLIIRCRIALITLSEIQKSGFQVLENLVTITPVRMWWIVTQFYLTGR